MKKRTLTKQMAEKMILAKLYRDGLFKVDDEKKTAEIDARRGVLVDLYQEESYEEIKDILNRTANGLKQAGYDVKIRWLDIVKGETHE